MWFLNRKIRELMKRLEKDADGNDKKMPKELKEVVHAIEDTAPAPANPVFQQNLRKQLLLKHKAVSFNPSTMKTASNKKPSKEEEDKKSLFDGWSWNFFRWQYAAALLVVVVISSVISYPLIPAPEVQGYVLKEGVRQIAYNAPIKISFSQLMDHGSVEKAFEISPAVSGKFEWRMNTMAFVPDEQFKPGQEYKVSIGRQAKSLIQKQMTYDYSEIYEITGPPQVILFNPSNELTNIPVDAKVTIMFDRPMTALQSLDEGEGRFPEIEISPKTAGRFKWLGTNAVMFIPEKLSYSTEYTVKVPEGVESAEGGKTDDEFVATFSTIKPALISSSPYHGYAYNGVDTKVKLDFNQPMNINNVKPYIHLYKYTGDNPDVIKGVSQSEFEPDLNDWEQVVYRAAYKSENDWKEEQEFYSADTDSPPEKEVLDKSIIIEPSGGLELKSYYLVTVDQGFEPAEGQFALETGTKFVFETVGALSVISTAPANGSDLAKVTDKYQRNVRNVEIKFSHPIESEEIEKFVTLAPLTVDKDTNEAVEPSVSTYTEDTTLSVRYSFKPSTEYTITVKAGLNDQFNQKLAEDYSFSFTTAPRDPEFELRSGYDINVLDANKDSVFYLKSVNLDYADVNMKKLSQEEFESVYARGYVSFYDANISGPYTSWKQDIKNTFNEDVYTKMNLDELSGGKLSPGAYYLDVSNPAVTNYNGGMTIDKHIFIVSYTGIAAKRSSEELMIWATSMKDGAPVDNFGYKVLKGGKEEIASGVTNSQGLATIDLTDKGLDEYADLMVFGTDENDYALVETSWSEGVAPWDFSLEYNPRVSDFYIYSYTDRPIYRPGHEVYFKGLVRIDADANFILPTGKKVHVVIEDPRGETVYEKDLALQSNGTYTDKLTLSPAARGGVYTIITSVNDGDEADNDKYDYYNRFYSSFQVAEYRKPDYELKLETDKENYVTGETAKIRVNGQYFFGAPMPDANIEWTLKSQDYYFFLNNDSDSPFANQWFSFSDEGYFCYWGCEGDSEVVSDGKAKLDANGEYLISLPLDISEKKLSQIYTLEVTAFDLNNQSVSNRVLVPVHEGEYYVGILNDDYVVSQGESAEFDIVTVDFDGMPLSGKSVEVQLLKREWNTVKKKNVDGGYYYENSYDDTLVESKTVTTDGQGKAATAFSPKDGGSFKVMAVSKDGSGHQIKASTTVYVSSSSFVNWGRDNNDKIELVADKLEYKPGETAHILVKSPYQNVWALVTQERGGILDKQVVKIESNSQTIDVPISEKSIPNVFVSVILVKGDDNQAGLTEPPAGESDERAYSAFKAGYATLQVDNSSKELMIDVSTDKAKYGPRDNVTVKVKTTDAEGNPVSADLSVSVVDKSVLSLTQNVTADLLNAFYRKRLLGVMSSHTLTKAISRVNVLVEAGLKGGGGGVLAKRGLFKDTAHFEASLETDASGYGELMFDLPDNLTTWEILAIGITDDTLVGSKKAEFLVTKDVLIRPVMPRFMTQSDVMTVGAIVHNYLDRDETFDVSVNASGVELGGSTNQKIRLKAGEERKVEWVVRVLNEAEAVFDIQAKSDSDGNVGDRLEQRMPIYPYSFPEIVSTSLTFDDDIKHVERVWLPLGIDENYGKLTVSASPTLTASISQGLEYLMGFPYGCAEQTASALLPNLVLKQLIALPVVDDNLVDAETLDTNIETGVQTLSKYQKENGGWGIWETSEPTPYLTSYVLFTLNEAKKSGANVDASVLNKGKEYLRKYMDSHPMYNKAKQPILDEAGQRVRDYRQREDANARAFGLYVLSEIGEPDTGLSVALFDYKDDLNLFGKAYLAMIYDKMLMGDDSFAGGLQGKIDLLKNEIMSEAKETPRGVHFEEKEHLYLLFDTDTRTTSVVLQMLSRIDADHPYIPKIVRNLLMEKKGGHYASTQETAMALIGMLDYLKNSGELEASYNLSVGVNGDEVISKNFTESNISEQEVVEIALSELLPDNQDNEIVFSKNGVGKVYGDVNLEYYLPTEEVKPRDEGILVTHEYFAIEDEEMEKPIKQIPVGENLKVKVTVVVPDDRYYVMMEDYLPAGLEGIDFSLSTSQQSLQDGDNGSDGGYYGGKGGYYYDSSVWNRASWYFTYSQVKDDRVMYFADRLPSGVYELEYFVRATTPGTFHDKPALAQELYFPEVFGRSQGDMFVVTE